MKMSPHKMFINLHVFLAGFFLVPAVMFAVTGGLYTFKITGTQKNTNWEFQADIQDPSSLAQLVSAAENQLKEKNLSFPTGSASIKKAAGSWYLEWTGSDKDFVLEPSAEAGGYKATLKEATWYRYFVQLHKAKGGLLFKLLAAGLAVAFIIIFMSGVLIAWRNPELKKKLISAFVVGSGLFALAAYLS